MFIGDTITVTYRIVEIDPARRRSRSEIQVTNQDGTLVAVGQHILKWVANPAHAAPPADGARRLIGSAPGADLAARISSIYLPHVPELGSGAGDAVARDEAAGHGFPGRRATLATGAAAGLGDRVPVRARGQIRPG